jgi:hypothetical protein
MCPLIHWELVADPLGSTELTLGTTAVDFMCQGGLWSGILLDLLSLAT